MKLPGIFRTHALLRLFGAYAFAIVAVAGAETSNVAARLQQLQQPEQATAAEGVAIRWRARVGVSRYRLQLATDNFFNDVVFDRAVDTNTYRVRELPPGKYYWRVAPATTETEAYTVVGVVTVAPAVERATEAASSELRPRQPPPNAPSMPVVTPKNPRALLAGSRNAGWQAAIGEVTKLGANSDAVDSNRILATDVAGTTYSFDPARGVALWIARFDPQQKPGEAIGRDKIGSLAPLAFAGRRATIKTTPGAASRVVLVRHADGVRLLDGTSGGEIWRATLSGVPTASVRINSAARGASLLVVTTLPDRLYFVDETNGRITREQTLDGAATGAPLVIEENTGAKILIAHDKGFTIYSDAGDDRPRTLKLDTRLTTTPHIVGSNTDARLLFGTERGLIALRLPDLRPAWRIATEGDAPRGHLTSRDLDADGKAEAVMVTQSGRIALVDVERGAIKWVTEGATDAADATFVDLDRDGVVDVFAAAGDAFANGYSGRDGSLIFREEEPGEKSRGGVLRSLVVATPQNANGNTGGALLIGADPGGTGLRAVRLSRSTIGVGR